MADGAMGLVNADAAGFVSGVLGERARPRQIVGVHIKDAGLRIKCRPTPFRAAIESRKNNGVFPHAEWNELPFAAEVTELLNRPLMHFRSAIGQQVFRQKLTRKRRRLGGKRLLVCGNLSGNIAWRIFMVLDGKQRRAVGAVEEIDKSLLGSLR